MSIRRGKNVVIVLLAGWIGIHPAISFAATNTQISVNGWDGVKGGATNKVSYWVSNLVMRVTFASGLSTPSSADLIATATNTDAGFAPVGFYGAAGLTNIMLVMTCSSNTIGASSIRILNEDGSHRWLRYLYPVGMQTTTVNYAISSPDFDAAASNGWALKMTSAETPLEPFSNWPAIWRQDMGYVSEVSVQTQRKTYSYSHWLELRALTFQSELSLDSITPAMGRMYNRFGVRTVEELSAAQKLEDSDQDGMPDYEVILADYEPGYFESNLFEIVSLKVELDQTHVAWKALRSNNYVVVRASNLDLGGDFAPLATYTNITKTGVFGWDDLDISGGVQYFYRVNKE